MVCQPSMISPSSGEEGTVPSLLGLILGDVWVVLGASFLVLVFGVELFGGDFFLLGVLILGDVWVALGA